MSLPNGAYPSGYNTFVPSFDASGRMVIGYSRNPKDFPLNKYVTIIPTKRSVGYYLKLNAENAARILSGSVSDFLWVDGNDAPTGEWNTDSFKFTPYITERYAFPFRIGYKASQQADWQLIPHEAGNAAQQAMTGRTLNVVSLMLNSANWGSSQVAAATSNLPNFSGPAPLDGGSSTNPLLKKAFNGMAQEISKMTLGKVQPKDLCVVIGPPTADRWGRSSEIQDYLKSSPFALAQIRGDNPSQNAIWGLPDTLYGFPIVVENSVLVSTRKGSNTQTYKYLFSSTAAPNPVVMVARPGQLVSEGSSSFSTIGLFMYEEMTVESRDDPVNRRTMGRVVDDYAAAVLSDISGFLLEDCFT